MSEEIVLPPSVFGKLRGHLTVKVDEILWVKNNPGQHFVELLWWGEKESHIFRPACINQPGNSTENDISVTFNIRTSLHLFENYIKKSGKLTFGIFKYPSKEHLGDVTVWNPYKTIFSGKFEQGYYPIFNKDRLRIGDLRISFELWMSKRDNYSEFKTDSARIINNKLSTEEIPKKMVSSSSSTAKDIDDIELDDHPLSDVLNRGKELRDAMTMSVLNDAQVDNIEKVLSCEDESHQNDQGAGLIGANKLMDFLMGKELPPEEEVLAIKTLRSVSPTQSLVNQELKSRLSSARSCHCCFKNNNSCSSCHSRSLSNLTSSNGSRPQTSSSGNTNHLPTSDTKNETKHIIELVNCYKLMIQCLHLNSLGIKKVKGVGTKDKEKSKKIPGLYYMIEHSPGSQTNISKEKPWKLKHTRFVSKKISGNEIIFGESCYLVETISGKFSWPKVLKQLNGTALKVHWRYHNQRLPCYLGSCIIKDDSINPSGLFSTCTLPVISNSGITVGHLSILLELGHNRKTFGNHLISCDNYKEINKGINDEDDMYGCTTVPGDRDHDRHRIWGRDIEKKARNMLVTNHNQCCSSSRNINPPTRTISYDSINKIDSQSKTLTKSRKSSSSSDISKDEKSSKLEEVIIDENKFKLSDIPSNIPDDLKSSESSENISTKSDSAKNDLQTDLGNLRPRSTTDASCQVTLERNSSINKKRESPSPVRLCKACLAMSDYKPDYTIHSNLPYNPDVPNWSKNDQFYKTPIDYGTLRNEPYSNYYSTNNIYRTNHSYQCCPTELPTSQECYYDMASSQLKSAHYYHSDHFPNHDYYNVHSSVPHKSKSSESYLYPNDATTLHELLISIDRILDFPMFNRELNNEADCFVDYTFPMNDNERVFIPHKRYSTEVSVILREVMFSTVTKHSLTLAASKCLDEVFNDLSFPSIDFNVWCRLYRSTPVDHVIAKAILPVSRICSLKQQFDEMGGTRCAKDKVCLPLLTVANPLYVQYPSKTAGTIEVTLIYKNFKSKVSMNDAESSYKYRSSRRDDQHNYRSDKGDHRRMMRVNNCCNNVNYNTIPRSTMTRVEPDPSCKQTTYEPSNDRIYRESTKEDRALSPIQEISVNSNSASDNIEHLRRSLERLVAQTDDIKEPDAQHESDSSLDAYLNKCRNVVQLESSSDDGLDSIIPNMKPDLTSKNSHKKNSTETTHLSLSDYQTSKKGNAQSGSLNSEIITARLNENFDECENISDDDTLKSVSSVNTDDSSSHVGFIAFNKDFVKNDNRKIKGHNKKSSNLPKQSVPKSKSSIDNSQTTSKCTQTTQILNINRTVPSNTTPDVPLFKVKIEIERAINLPLLAPYGSINKQKPSCYVSFDAYSNGNVEHIASDIVYNCSDPIWNATWNVKLPTEYLYKCNKKFVVNVMLLSHLEDGPVRAGRKEEERRKAAGKSLPSGTAPSFKHSMLPKGALRKQALIDLTSISAGLPFILGWYSLTTETTSCSGQIKVKVTPMEDVSKHKNIWFKEYSQWEKGHKLSVNTEGSKVDSSKWKMSGNVDQPSETFKQQKDKKVSVDPIDRDLVYISLNQKLAELDKIPGYFKDRNYQSTEETIKPSCSKTSQSILLSTAVDRNQPSTSSKLDIMDLNIDSDISYVNRLLSEIPNRLTSSRNHVNFTGNNENEMYPRPVLGPTNQVLKKPQDFISASFNSSDVLDLENDKTKGKSFRNDIDRMRNLNLDHQVINLDMDIIDRNMTKSNSDESLRNQAQSISEQNRAAYQRLSPELSIENKTISGSSNLPSECYQQCGNEPSSCVFNNRNIFPNANRCELSRMSPVISVASKENSSLLDPYEPNNYTRTENIPDYTGFQPTERLDVESEGTDEASKYVATLSGQSSLCTDDQSLHYSEPLNSQGIAYDLSFSDNAGNLHSDLMEEASSEIDRILRELKNNK